MRKLCWVWLLGWALLGPLNAAEPTGVVVEMKPAVIQRRSFDPARPPREMPKLTPPEVGTCVFEFACDTDVRATGRRTIVGRSPSARVSYAKITGRLRITIWTPLHCPPKILAHEEGHRAICERYYQPAAELARRIGEGMVGTSLAVPIHEAAGVQAALKRLQDEAIAAFMRGTMARCEFAQDRFDAITQHSIAPIGEAEAMAQAIADETVHAREMAGVARRRPAM